MIGICPQFNVQFEVLTVKENLRTFAEIKGIKSKEVEREVRGCSPGGHHCLAGAGCRQAPRFSEDLLGSAKFRGLPASPEN